MYNNSFECNYLRILNSFLIKNEDRASAKEFKVAQLSQGYSKSLRVKQGKLGLARAGCV